MNKLAFLFISILFYSCSHPQYSNPHVIIKTDMGDIELELFPDKAPKTAAAFLEYVDSGYYRNASFYRVVKAEELPTDYNSGLIQAGIYRSGSKMIDRIKPIPHESTQLSGLSHINGIVSFANQGAGTATTEFFICIGDQSGLDAGRRGSTDGLGFAAFGKVFKGMNTVKRIQNQNSRGDMFEKKIDISDIRRL